MGDDIISASDAICLYTEVLHFAGGRTRAAWSGVDISLADVYKRQPEESSLDFKFFIYNS